MAEALRTNTTLHTLGYDAAVLPLPSHPSSLEGNIFGDVGAQVVAEAVRTNTTLHTLQYDAAMLE